VSRYQKGKANLDFTEARDSEWQWHQLGHMQVCTSLKTDNHASTPPLSFLQAGCPSCRPTNSVKALKAEGNTVGQCTLQQSEKSFENRSAYGAVDNKWRQLSLSWLLLEHARQIASQRVDRGVSRGVQGAWHGEVDKSRALFATN